MIDTSSFTIDDVKTNIQQMTGIPPDCQQIRMHDQGPVITDMAQLGRCAACGHWRNNIFCEVVNYGTPLKDDYSESEIHGLEINEIVHRGKTFFAHFPLHVMHSPHLQFLKRVNVYDYVKLLVFHGLGVPAQDSRPSAATVPSVAGF